MFTEHTSKFEASGEYILLLFLFFFAVFSIFLRGIPTGGDEWGMYLVAQSIVEDGDVYLDDSDIVVLRQGAGGRWVSKYGIGQSLVEAPVYLFARMFARGADDALRESIRYFVTSFVSPAIGAGVCVFVFLICCELGYLFSTALFITFLTGLGSLVWPYSKTVFSEPLQAMCITAAFYFLIKWRARHACGHAAPAGFLLGLLVATKPYMLLAVAPFVFFLLGGLRGSGGRTARAGVFVFFAMLVSWIGIEIFYNYLRFGDPMQFGYLGGADRDAVHGFSLPLLVGLHGLLFSSGKGLIFYVPAVALSVFAFRTFARKRRAEAWVIGAVFIIVVLAYSKWNAWHGDFAWGPRFLMPVVPLLLIPAGALLEEVPFFRRAAGRSIVAVLFAVSVFIQIPGSAVNYNEYLVISKTQVPFHVFFKPGRVGLRDDMLNVHYIPEFSPFAGHYWLLRHTLFDRDLPRSRANEVMKNDYPWKSLMPYAPPGDPARGLGFDAWWFYYLKYFPGTSDWVYRLAAVLIFIATVSGAGIAFGAMRKRE
ncbi:MAG TPA: hypothetical protein PLN69_02815 [bacterium]|nr:hypothetical protein [bacterium]